ETRTFVSFHRQRLLLHPVLPSLSTPLYNAPSSYAVDLISNALDPLTPWGTPLGACLVYFSDLGHEQKRRTT
ncbi:hypothetical protein, partial [Paraburkholderia sp. EG304]|uniref:hypothetical protein n=1 Tax=Paraburkholderia sp. EG304 TaxID=3237015 RepID=UPI00397B7F64